MNYKVIQTLDHTEPLENWRVVFHVTDEQHALELMSKHYNTQLANEENYNEETDCFCEDCAAGFRVRDWKAVMVQVQAIDGDICPDCLAPVSYNEGTEQWQHDEPAEGCYLAYVNGEK